MTAATQNGAVVPADAAATRPPLKIFRNLQSKIALTPMITTALFVFIGCSLWTIAYSFTTSRILPAADYWKNFVGLDQYTKLFDTPRWQISVRNVLVFSFFSLLFHFVVGFLLAV